jgi:hypothetical protein
VFSQFRVSSFLKNGNQLDKQQDTGKQIEAKSIYLQNPILIKQKGTAGGRGSYT